VSNLSVNENQQPLLNWEAVLLPVCSVAAVAWMLVSYARIGRDILSYMGIGWFAVLLRPFVLLSAALLLRRRRRVGYMVAAVGAGLPLKMNRRSKLPIPSGAKARVFIGSGRHG